MEHYAKKNFNIRPCSKSCEVKDRTPMANVIKTFFQHNSQYCQQIIIHIDIDYDDCGVIMSIFIQLVTDVNVIKLFSAQFTPLMT